MNFTREPIIETIITPKDGFKLVVSNTKGTGIEYSVDAVEVVSFGEAIFYRSFEKPKAFLLPVSDFEIVEVRETKIALKNVPIDKTIKIAGGKEASKTSDTKKNQEAKEIAPTEKKKKRTRKKKTSQETKDEKQAFTTKTVTQEPVSHVKTLIPPPTTLIAETISRYRLPQESGDEDVIVPEKAQAEMQAAEQNPIGEVPHGGLDPIWVDEPEPTRQRENNELDSEKDSSEPIKLAAPPQDDEPIGKTHAEEKLQEDPLHTSSRKSDDQK